LPADFIDELDSAYENMSFLSDSIVSWSCKNLGILLFLLLEISYRGDMGVKNFDFAPKFPKNWEFLAPNIVFL